MTRLGGHVTIFSQVPAQTLDEFRVNSVHGGARVSSFHFCVVAIGLSKYKYALRRAPLKLFCFLREHVGRKKLKDFFNKILKSHVIRRDITLNLRDILNFSIRR